MNDGAASRLRAPTTDESSSLDGFIDKSAFDAENEAAAAEFNALLAEHMARFAERMAAER